MTKDTMAELERTIVLLLETSDDLYVFAISDRLKRPTREVWSACDTLAAKGTIRFSGGFAHLLVRPEIAAA